MSRFGCEGNEE